MIKKDQLELLVQADLERQETKQQQLEIEKIEAKKSLEKAKAKAWEKVGNAFSWGLVVFGLILIAMMVYYGNAHSWFAPWR